MKCFVFGVLALFCLQARLGKAYDESDLDQTDLSCLKELGYEKSVVINSYDENDFIKEGNSKMNTFYGCAWKKDNLLNNDGSVNPDNLQKMMENKLEKLFPDHPGYRAYLAKESVKDCKDIKGNDDGEKSVKIYNCLLGKVGELSQKTKPEDYA